jgi:enoyl-CoA hydratase/carnithine racemase
MEAILGADDFDAEVAERYGWINRALADAELDAFVTRLARRIASFPADARRFHQLVVSDAAQDRTAALFTQGLQTRGPLELDLGDRIGTL